MFKKIIILLITISTLQSCIGLGFGVVKGEVDKSYKVKGKDFILLSDEKGDFSHEFINPYFKNAYYKKPKTYTKQEVLSLWGTPSHKKTDKKTGREVWVYKRELAWSGAYIIAIAILPIYIPLVAPVGTRNTELYFVKDKLDTAVKYDGVMKYSFGIGAGCYPRFSQGGYECSAVFGKKVFKTD